MNLKVMQVSEPETWRFHPVYSKYVISSHGRVFSFKQHKIIRHRINYGSKSRKVVAAIHNLSINAKAISLRVHTLVADAFLPPKPTPKHSIDHIDINPLNNYYKNLRWATQKEQCNNQHRNIHKRDGKVYIKPPVHEKIIKEVLSRLHSIY